ncbi:MAG: 23S rRNA pseudouridine2605 synthase, partial [Planctomycetota bacterium]
NREVRRTFARVGHKVVSLKRIRIGPLTDRGIKTGKWRSLSRAEVEALLEDGSGRPTTEPVHPSVPIDRDFPAARPERPELQERQDRAERQVRQVRPERQKPDRDRTREPREMDQPTATGYGTIRRTRSSSGGTSRGGSGGARRGASGSSRGGGGSSRGSSGSARRSGGPSRGGSGSSRGSSGPRTPGGSSRRRTR